MLTAFLPLAAFLATAVPTSVDPEAPALAAQALADAERVLAVHAIPGAVVFDLDRAGDQFQLTIALDDDGAVVDTAIAWVGPAATDGGVALGAAAYLDHLDRIDRSADGSAVILVGGAAAARLPITAAD